MRANSMRLAAVVAALGVWAPAAASAFCGFYVGSAEADLVNEGTMVVLLRDGTTTVLSMQNDYRGPPEDFALVVPVPVVLAEAEVRTLPAEIFSRVERLAAPRLVEYWEQDPCPEPRMEGIGLGNIGTIGHGGGGGSGSGFGRGVAPQVTVEAEFAVGEYDIVILSARDSGALDAWLRSNGYRIPEGAGEVLRPYVEADMKFFVAKVDVERVTFEGGRALLSPLRVHYDSDEFSLPVRLGLLNSHGAQDLIVHVLAKNQRYEVANYPNVTVPTNLDVSDGARARFGEFYAALFDTVVERNEGAVVTEYAWQASGCDPCPGPVLDTASIMTLGGDVITGGGAGQGSSGAWANGPPSPTRQVARIRFGVPEVQGTLHPEVVRRMVRRHAGEVRSCYQAQLTQNPFLAGRVTIEATVGPSGAVQAASVSTSTLGNAAAEDCIAAAFRRWTFVAPSDGGVAVVRFPFMLSIEPGPGSGNFGRGRFGGGPFADMVLTRLHYRYGPDGLGEDLVFRPAAPISGGRETPGPGGDLEEGASPSGVNNFQARYAIRHPWEGPIECENPRRGVWGHPPEGTPRPGTAAATNLAQAPRGNAPLGSFLTQALPALGGATVAAAQPGPPNTEAAEASGAEEASPGSAAAVDSGGCGCSVQAGPGRSEAALIVFALGGLALRRRSRG